MIRKKTSKIGYMCAVDYQHEMDVDVSDGIEVYSTIEFLKKKRPCVKECGIIKVKVTLEEWVTHSDYKRKHD